MMSSVAANTSGGVSVTGIAGHFISPENLSEQRMNSSRCDNVETRRKPLAEIKLVHCKEGEHIKIRRVPIELTSGGLGMKSNESGSEYPAVQADVHNDIDNDQLVPPLVDISVTDEGTCLPNDKYSATAYNTSKLFP